jgi:hypothetical protein
MLEIKSRGTIFIFGVFQDCAWIFEKRGKKKLKQGGETLQHLPVVSLLKPCFSFNVPSFPFLDLLML